MVVSIFVKGLKRRRSRGHSPDAVVGPVSGV